MKELIDLMRQSPGMYIGSPSITRFKSFLDGYIFAKMEEGKRFCDSHLLSAFQAKVAKKYSIKTAHGWNDILLFVAGNEPSAFELFWILWDEHLEESHYESF